LKGNWSAFSGRITVLGADYRINNTAGVPAAAMQLSSGVTVCYFGNLNAKVPVGELSGVQGSTLSGLNNNNNGVSANTLTWEVGARGTDAAFAGNITNGTSPSLTAIRKVGTGTWTLSGTCTYTGATDVADGTLRILGSASGSKSLTVAAGSTLEISGTGSLAVSGTMTNNGTIRFYGSPAFSSTGPFINNGVLDLINGARTLPANLQNNGVILQAGDVRVLGMSMSGGKMSLSVRCYAGHTYKLQTTSSLANPAWTDITDSAFTPVSEIVHDFTDAAPGSAPKFYRIFTSP